MSDSHGTPSARSKVALREITADTVRTICGLSVGEEQREFVAPNAEGGPQGFYERLGLELTGEWEEGEAMMRLRL